MPRFPEDRPRGVPTTSELAGREVVVMRFAAWGAINPALDVGHRGA